MSHLFYTELASYWPLLSPPHEYAEEAQFAATLLAKAAIPLCDVLELGSGGGHLASHLRHHFTMTLTDLSEPMLAISRTLNPGCEHVAGDMRTLRLGRAFDGILIHDAIDYMTTEGDLVAALTTAFEHCRPGGVCAVVPDSTRETFAASTDCGGEDGVDGSGARYLAWSWDPDPNDDWVQTEYSFVLRDARGQVTTAHESHRSGLFAEERWLRALRLGGFEPKRVLETTTDDRPPRVCFVGHRPGATGPRQP